CAVNSARAFGVYSRSNPAFGHVRRALAWRCDFGRDGPQSAPHRVYFGNAASVRITHAVGVPQRLFADGHDANPRPALSDQARPVGLVKSGMLKAPRIQLNKS